MSLSVYTQLLMLNTVLATRVEVLFYTAYMSKLITRSPLSRVVSFAKRVLASKKNCAQKNLEPNSIFGNGFLEIEKLVLRFH